MQVVIFSNLGFGDYEYFLGKKRNLLILTRHSVTQNIYIMKSKRNKTESQLEEIVYNEAGESNEINENCELQSPQTQTRWTPECTRVMLQLRFERQIEFHQRIRQKKELWSEIATEMRRQGLCDFSLTAEVCDLKYRNMLQTYKKNRLKEDSGMQSLIAWEYYDLFKEGLTATDELDGIQEGQRHVVPLLLCESVCEVSNEDAWSVTNELDSKISIMDAAFNAPKDVSEIDAEDTESTSNITVNRRKRKKKSFIKIEESSQLPANQNNWMKAEISTPSGNSKTENITNIASSEFKQPPQVTIKPDSSARPQRKYTLPACFASIPTANIENDSVETNVSTMNVMQNDPIISSTSTSTIPMPTLIHVSPLQPCAQSTLPPTSPNQISKTTVRSNKTQVIPINIAPSEMRECQVFGESIGLQLAHVSDPHVRAMAQLKIQELLYLAKIGKLLETARL